MSKTAAEPLVRISKREGATFVQKVLVRAIAILLALVVDAFFIFFVTGLNPISVYGVMWNGTIRRGAGYSTSEEAGNSRHVFRTAFNADTRKIP